MQKSVFIYTYGCQMNVHDSEKMLGILSEKGYASATSPEDADLVIFNTCAIRAKAEQKFYSQLGRIKLLKKKRSNLKIAVAGCVAQDAKNKIFKRAPFVDIVLGPQNIGEIHSVFEKKGDRVLCDDNHSLAIEELKMERQHSLKAWVSIMYGCNNFCSYCIVPFTRGREVSRPSSSISSEIRNLGEKGYMEITLLGQNVNSYRSDTDFSGLLKIIDSFNMNRVRFVTSHPRDLSPVLISTMAELPSVCEHLHLPLQAGADDVLLRMNRGYTFARYLQQVKMLREMIPGIALTTDIIVGFPGETDEDFLQTVRAVEEIEFDGIFAFKYSPRRGTKAAEMGDHISDKVKTERIGAILELQEEISLMKNQLLVGTVQEVLVEGISEADPAMFTGRTRTNKIVNMPSSSSRIGTLVMTKILRAGQHSLYGEDIGFHRVSQ